MLNGKSLLKYRNLFFLKEYKTNEWQYDIQILSIEFK